MIPGFSSAGIAAAIRTVGRARDTMDKMARQIATGQRVASVKDDGAAWARAAGLKSQVTGQEVIRQSVAGAQMHAAVMMEIGQQRLSWTEQALGFSIRQRQSGNSVPPPGPGTAEYDTLLDQAGAQASTLAAPDNAALLVFGGSYAPRVLTSDTGTTRVAVDPSAVAEGPFDYTLLNHWTAVIGENQTNAQALRMGMGQLGASMRRLEHEDRAASIRIDRLTSAIGSLTEADLGKASAARAQADTRQQLALSTVRQAISSYAGFASGLLGNVQRTQRGISA